MITYTVEIYEAGSERWFHNDKLHREDGPAIQLANGDKWWYLNDKRHREDGPAIEMANGDKFWYLNDKLHREDGPAVENAKWLKSIRTPNGDKRWFLNGKGLSESKWKQQVKKSDCSGNPSFTYTVEISDTGDKRWYLNGKLHRGDGPASEYVSGTKEWYLNGKLHRENGPAIEYADGDKYWVLNGKQLSESAWKQQVKKSKSDCSGKVVEIDGKKYKLMEI